MSSSLSKPRANIGNNKKKQEVDARQIQLSLNPFQSLVHNMLNNIGEDAERPGLERTPERFERAFRELTAGYRLSPQEAIGEGVFDSESEGLITVRDIEFFSLCEHHLLPFWGKANISYYPNKKILGLSKLARVVEVFARRLQVQERLTAEIAKAIHELVDSKAISVKLEAQHMCMMMRGVRKVGSSTVTDFSLGLESLDSFERQRIFNAVN
jgi:GTP cyclohydrolase I